MMSEALGYSFLAALALLIAAVCICCCRRRNRAPQLQAMELNTLPTNTIDAGFMMSQQSNAICVRQRPVCDQFPPALPPRGYGPPLPEGTPPAPYSSVASVDCELVPYPAVDGTDLQYLIPEYIMDQPPPSYNEAMAAAQVMRAAAPVAPAVNRPAAADNRPASAVNRPAAADK